MMKKLSTGADATLGEHRKLAVAAFGEDSPAVAYLDEKILAAPNGEDEEVVADESQVVNLLSTIHLEEHPR